MIICPNCQKQQPDDANFCDSCGTQFQQADTCPDCGNQTPADLDGCQTCDVQFADPAAPVEPETKNSFDFNAILDKVKALPKKTLGLIGGGVVALIAIIVVIAVIAGSAMPNYAVYKKDGDLIYRDLSKKSGVEIEDAQSAALSSDGKTLFIVEDDGDLVYRNINKKNGESKKWINTDGVEDLMISENGKVITFTKDGSLYQKKLGAETQVKIASDVEGFTVTSNGAKILYVTKESDIYYVGKVKENPKTVKVAGGVDEGSLKYISDDLKTIVYLKDNTLYSAVAGKNPVKIASDVDNIRAFNDKNIYYTIEKQVKEGEVILETNYSLFYYDGKESKSLVEDKFYGFEDYSLKSEVIVYQTRDESEKTVNAEYYVACNGVTNKLHSYSYTYNDNYERNDYEDIDGTAFSENGKTLYFLIKNNPAKTETDASPITGELKSVSVGKKLGTIKSIDTNVYALSSYTKYADKPVYIKEYKKTDDGNSTYDIYVNKKVICTDVVTFNFSKKADGFIITTNDKCLKFYKSKLVTISDDYNKENNSYSVLPTGDILFNRDVNDKGKGDLYRFTGKKSKMIDSDVTGVMGVSYLEDTYKDGNHLYLYCPGIEDEA